MSKSKKSRAPGLPPHLTSAQVCFLLGLTRGRVAQLSDDGGPIVRVGRDRYAIESIPNFVRRQRERGDRSIAWQEARAQAMGERAKILRLQRRKVEGETMLISEVIAMGNVDHHGCPHAHSRHFSEIGAATGCGPNARGCFGDRAAGG